MGILFPIDYNGIGVFMRVWAVDSATVYDERTLAGRLVCYTLFQRNFNLFVTRKNTSCFKDATKQVPFPILKICKPVVGWMLLLKSLQCDFLYS